MCCVAGSAANMQYHGYGCLREKWCVFECVETHCQDGARTDNLCVSFVYNHTPMWCYCCCWWRCLFFLGFSCHYCCCWSLCVTGCFLLFVSSLLALVAHAFVSLCANVSSLLLRLNSVFPRFEQQDMIILTYIGIPICIHYTYIWRRQSVINCHGSQMPPISQSNWKMWI